MRLAVDSGRLLQDQFNLSQRRSISLQNSVLELWSLFDFLMPGFLGTEQEFNVAFTKPIVASRDAKSSSKEQENGLWKF